MWTENGSIAAYKLGHTHVFKYSCLDLSPLKLCIRPCRLMYYLHTQIIIQYVYEHVTRYLY